MFDAKLTVFLSDLISYFYIHEYILNIWNYYTDSFQRV